jgi:hypothetical protein
MAATDRLLTLPRRPAQEPFAGTSTSARLERERRYRLAAWDELVRAVRDQGPRVRLPNPRVIAAHFGALTVTQALFWSAVLCERYGAVLTHNDASCRP